jgi:hypothetical protein
MEIRPQSRGEYLVGTSYRRPADSMVDKITIAAASMIDVIEQIEDGDDRKAGGDVKRLKALAITATEEAAMWAVKAQTKPAHP